MLLYVVVPTCRSTAEAVQILFSHAFGDAGSPYLIGVVKYLYKRSSLGLIMIMIHVILMQIWIRLEKKGF